MIVPGMSAQDDRPAWAVQLRLPHRETLTYAQALLVAAALGFAALYLATRALSSPSAVLRAARKKTGV